MFVDQSRIIERFKKRQRRKMGLEGENIKFTIYILLQIFMA